MSTNCWASVLRDCARGSSREHYISDGIFDGQQVTAIGLSWCRHVPMTIGLKSAVAKILCGKHNSALSPFDTEAGKLSRFLQTNILHHPLEEGTISLNGSLLEKWALKTFLNLGYIRGLHREQPNRLEPRPDLVRYIYENAPIADGVGLYLVTGKVSNDDSARGVWWNVIQNPQRLEEIFGMVLQFFGVRLVVSISPSRAEEKIAHLGEVNGFDYSTAQIIYRPSNIILVSDIAGRKDIHLEW